MKAKLSEIPLTVLFVEDHDDTRTAITRWFKFSGYKVIGARSKLSAITLGRKNAFDVLICDLQLPDGDGVEVMSALRAEKSFIGVAVSGHGTATDIARTKAAGFFMHITKPFSADEMEAMLAAVRRKLDRPPMAVCREGGRVSVSSRARA